MWFRPRSVILAFTLASLAGLPGVADAQFGKKIRDAAKRAAERETVRQVDRQVTEAVRCALTDQACIDNAKADGKEVEVVDAQGNVVSPSQEPTARPGEGAWANYDFVPGEEILFFDDYSNDRVGDFPRRLELVEGSWEIVDWEGGRYLRATSNGILAIPLPKTLPERFTIEYPVNLTHGNAWVSVMPGRAYFGPARNYRGSVATVAMTRAGVRPAASDGPTALAQFDGRRMRDAIHTFRVMADGEHMKVYLGEQRVANVPNAVFPRSDTLFIALSSARESHPILIGPIRIAAGGRHLYDALEREGRVATQGILFDTGSDRIRPESTPTLDEITAMLEQHGDLRILIEGHTDSVGDAAANQALSERRASAVRAHLVQRGIDASRLQAQGLGESRPAASNDTPEGRQQNRRVELVRM